jgi:hypothetical protein
VQIHRKTYKIDGIHQTIYHALGISPETNYEIKQRFFYTTPNDKGKAEIELLPKALYFISSHLKTPQSAYIL